MLYENGEIIKADNCYVWTYAGQELRVMLAASSIDILRFKIDTFLSFDKNILSKSEQLALPKNIQYQIENLDNYNEPQREKLLTTLQIILNEKELSKMSKQFKKSYTLYGLIVRVRFTKTGVYELRYRRNGYNIAVSHKQLEIAKEKFKQALLSTYTKRQEPKKEIKKEEPSAYKYTEMWLETAKKPYIAENTYRNYQKYLKTNLKPFFEEKKLSNFSLSDLQAFINKYVNDEKFRTAQGLRTMLREIYKFAKFDKIILENPAEGLKPVVYEQEHGKALSIEKDKALAEKICKSELKSKNALLLLLCFGLRPIELQKTEIDLKTGFLQIISAKQRKGRKKVTRKVPITTRANRLIDFSANFKFSTRQVEIDIKKIDADIIPYDMRHTFITNAKESGVPKEVVGLWVGHSPDKSMTSKVYTHFSDEYMLEQAKKIDY